MANVSPKKLVKQKKTRTGNESTIDNLNIKSQHTWLNHNNLDVNNGSDDYFKDISYFIDLQHLYKIVDTCYYHAEMPYVPVLVEMQSDRLIEAFDRNSYLLQLWDRNTKKKVFQTSLNNFTQSKIRGAFDTNQIKDVSFIGKYFIVATKSNELQIYDEVVVLIKMEQKVIDLRQNNIRDTYQCDLNIQALLIQKNQYSQDLIIVLETKNNQLDFNILDLNFITDENQRIFNCFKQIRDISPREQGYISDPIKKVVFKFHHKDNNFAVALRQSGAFDIYCNMLHKQQVCDVKMADVGMSLQHFFFKTQEGSYFTLKQQEANILSYEQAEPLLDTSFEMRDIKCKILERYAKFYSFFQLLMIDDTTLCIVAHQKFISVFDIINWKWINHIQFESEIVSLFFQKTSNNQYKSCVYLKNNDLFFDVSKFFYTTELVTSSQCSLKLLEETYYHLEVCDNSVDYGDVFFIALGTDMVYVCYGCEKYEIESPFTGYNDDGNFRCLFLVQQPYNDTNTASDINLIGLDCEDIILLKLHKNKSQSLIKIKDIGSLNEEEQSDIQNTGHSSVSMDKCQNFVIFCKSNAYVVDSKVQSLKKVQEVNCQGLVLFNRNVNYGTFFESATQDISGLKMIDFKQLIQNQTIKLTLLKEIDIGAYGNVYFDNEISRICFIESLKNIVVHPFLHMNTNKFMGMKDSKDYICHRIINHKLIAFKKKGELISWDVFTGKYLKKVILQNHDYSNFDVVVNSTLDDGSFKKRVLLISQFKKEGCKNENYFTKDQLATSTKDQMPLIKVSPHSFRQFILIEISSQDKIEIKLDFIFPKFDIQQMFINDACNRMIIRLEFQRVFLYQSIPQQTLGGNVMDIPQWELLRQITDYPFFFDNAKTNKLEPFTKDLSLYIRYVKTTKAFIIKYSDTGETHSIVPNDIMNIGLEKTDHIINRFKWLDNERFLVVNANGLEKIVNIQQKYKEESFNQRPLFNDISGNEWEVWPYYVKREYLKKDTLSRLKRMYQTYKTRYYLFNERDPYKFQKYMFTVDQHDIQLFEHSFTFLQWSILDQMNNKMIKVKNLDPGMIQLILYNILPGGNTVFHKLYKSQEKISKIFRMSHPNKEIMYHVPFLQNIQEYSPFDLSLNLSQNDYKSIFSNLLYLKLYPMDHHSRAIKSVYHVMIGQQTPEFLDYLDTRFQQTTELEELDKGSIVKEFSTSGLWIHEQKIKDDMLDQKPSEAKIKLELLDMPSVYHFQDYYFVKIFKELSSAESFKFFDNRAIKVLIDFNYPIVRSFLIALLIIPFCIFHVVFVVYMNVVYEYRIEEYYELPNYILSSIQILFVIYFLINECKQFANLGLQYLTSVWNYVDLIAPIGVAVLHGFQFAEYHGIDIDVDIIRSVLAISTFFMWLKFLSSLRIFKETGYLIRMIIEVIYDMGIFLMVLLITVAAFGDTFLRISNGNIEEEQFIESFIPAVAFAYSMILGTYDINAFGEVAQPLVWIFWVLCTILDMIVMLNLLIAIISSTYERVSENAEQASYQEMAALISENHYLIPNRLTDKYAEKNKFVLVATDMEKQNDFKDPLDIKFELLQGQINDLKKIIFTETEKLTESHKSLFELNIANDSKNQEKLGEMKILLIRSIPPETISVTNHKNPLTKILLYHLQEKRNFQSYFSWGCDGRKFTGCKSGYQQSGTDMTEKLYHCKKCEFDYCVQCYQEYANAHVHELTEMTLQELCILDSDYQTGWGCDGRFYTGCPQGDTFREDIYEFLYHDDENDFDFCTICARKYKFEEPIPQKQ
eukprot:403375928